MSAPLEIGELVKRFDCNRESYCSSAYNETETRREFIDPFFKALGWHMANEKKYAETEKTEREKSLIQRQIDATDKQIDQLVYELYGLTDEEIRIVEEVTK